MTAPVTTDRDAVVEDAAINLSNGLGRLFDRVSTLASSEEVEAVAQETSDQAWAVAEANGLPHSIKAVTEDTSRADAFAGGALHATEHMAEGFALRSSQPASAPHHEHMCVQVGEALADLQFDQADKILFASQEKYGSDRSEGSNGWVDGRQYAMARAIANYRTRLEQRVLGLVEAGSGDPRTRRALAILLFVAVTGANRRRIERSLGEGVTPLVDELDEANLISCATKGPSPRMRVTPLGRDVARDLLRGDLFDHSLKAHLPAPDTV